MHRQVSMSILHRCKGFSHLKWRSRWLWHHEMMPLLYCWCKLPQKPQELVQFQSSLGLFCQLGVLSPSNPQTWNWKDKDHYCLEHNYTVGINCNLREPTKIIQHPPVNTLSWIIYSITMYICYFYDGQIATDLGLPMALYLYNIGFLDTCWHL